MLTITAVSGLRDAAQVAHSGVTLLARGGLAVTVGWAGARLMHARRLHWSWGLALVAVSALACAIEVPALSDGLVLGARGELLAAATATVAARRWQLSERRSAARTAGGPPDRQSPADTLRLLLPGWPGVSRGRETRDGLVLGTTRDRGRAVVVPARHTLVVGATGAGKTMTLRRLVGEAAEGMGVVAVDGKGDPELERDLAQCARDTGRRFLSWSPTRASRYSPFCHGTDTEIVDKALAAESWGDDYYLRLGQRFLGFAVRALRAAQLEPTLGRLAHYVDPTNLEQLAPAMEEAAPGSWNELVARLPALDRSERQAIAGTQHRLATLAESDVGELLVPEMGHVTIDLLETVRGADVAYFDLNADARPALSRMLGAAIVMDLVSVAATMQRLGEYMPTVLVLDDVHAFASEAALRGVAGLFARGRSAGMMLVLGTQSLADFNLRGAHSSIEQLLDNRTTLIVHRLPGYASANRASHELGDREGERLSEQLEARAGGWRQAGAGTRVPIVEPNVPPAELMELETGVAVVKTSGQAPRLTNIARPAR